MSVSTSTNKTSDLVSCYRELVAAVPVETLFEKYPRVEVLAAIELRQRGITLQQLEDFIRERDTHLAKMRREKL